MPWLFIFYNTSSIIKLNWASSSCPPIAFLSIIWLEYQQSTNHISPCVSIVPHCAINNLLFFTILFYIIYLVIIKQAINLHISKFFAIITLDTTFIATSSLVWLLYLPLLQLKFLPQNPPLLLLGFAIFPSSYEVGLLVLYLRCFLFSLFIYFIDPSFRRL